MERVEGREMGLEEGSGRDEGGDVAGEDMADSGGLVDTAVEKEATLVVGNLAPARFVVLGACSRR